MKRFCLLAALFSLTIACDNGDTIEVTGTLEGNDQIVSSQVAGLVKSVLKSEGDSIRAGEVILQIDTTDYYLNVLQAHAVYRQARAALDLIQNGARREDIRVAAEAKEAARANLTAAQRDHDRIAGLLKTQSASQKQADDAATRLEVAKATFQQAEESWNKLVRGARREDIDMAQARADQAEAQWMLARKKLSDCRIRAMQSGLVSTVSVDPGELVQPGSQVALVTSNQLLTMSVYLREPDLGLVQLGDSVTIRVDSFEDRAFTGIIRYLSPTAEFTPKNIQSRDDRVKLVFEARLDVPNHDGALKAGMPGDAFINRKSE